MLYQATVTATGGNTVNLRDSYKNGSIITRVPIGNIVNVLEETNAEWAKITTLNGTTGYMMKQFLVKNPQPAPGGEYYVELKCENVDEAKRVLEALGRATIVGN